MRALTLTQPWAGLVASGIKLIENRPRNMAPRDQYGSQFAIHASRQIDESVYARIDEIAPRLCRGHIIGGDKSIGDWWHLSRITSAVIAVATLVTYVSEYDADTLAPAQRRWFFGPIGYVLRDVIAIEKPVPCKGALGFWRLSEDVEAKVRAQL
jgi:hypothetical protein